VTPGGGARAKSSSPVSPAGDGRERGGDHVVIEVLGARSGAAVLSERDYYIKASLCDNIDGDIYPVDGTTQKTGRSRGPMPIWAAKPLKLATTFRGHCIALELKENRMLGDNKHIGVCLFPTNFFHKFGPDTVVDTWHPVRANCESQAETVATLRVRMSVPGGCPHYNGAAFKVTQVIMNERKLRVTVFDAELFAPPGGADADEAQLPSTYVSVHLDGDIPKEKGVHIKSKTAVVKRTLTPTFDHNFEFFAESGKCKLLSLKLKTEGGFFGGTENIGVVKIPIQFYMAQKSPADVEEVFRVLDDAGAEKAKLHVRLQVLSTGDDAEEDEARHARSASGQFRRTTSLPKAAADGVDGDDHPMLSPLKGQHVGRHGGDADGGEAGGDIDSSVLSDDTQAAEAAAAQCQQGVRRR
jgi:hypothetical protein